MAQRHGQPVLAEAPCKKAALVGTPKHCNVIARAVLIDRSVCNANRKRCKGCDGTLPTSLRPSKGFVMQTFNKLSASDAERISTR